MAKPWRTAQAELGRLAGVARLGLVSDLDGTLAPIAATAAEAQLGERGRELLAALSQELPLVAVLSGRGVLNLRAKVGLPGVEYVGNHGLERLVGEEVALLPAVRPYLAAVQAVRQALGPLEQAGALVEDKGATVSLHFRQVADPDAFGRAQDAPIEALAAAHGLQVFRGKMVYEIRPPVAMNKGLALRQLVAEAGLEAVLFIGDDTTDLDALEAARQLRASGACQAWGVAVQSADAPEGLEAAADWLAAGVADVEDLLAWLLAARRASST